MERKEITVRFSDLRRFASSVPNYLAKQAGINELPTLETAIEDDWGMADLDTEILIEDFGKHYSVELSHFDFTVFISYGPTVKDTLLFIPLIVLLVASWLFKSALALIFWVFNRTQAKRIWKSSSLAFWIPIRKQDLSKVLTVGDFVASAATGYFVKREQVRFILEK